MQYQKTLTTTKPEAGLASAPQPQECALASVFAAIGSWMNAGLSIVAVAFLGGCATTSRPDAERGKLPTAIATQRHSPLPHGGNLADLSRWWARFDDPLLLRLIDAGRQASAMLVQAATGDAHRVFPGAFNPASRRPTKQAST